MLFEEACIFLQSSEVKARMIKDSCSRGEDKKKNQRKEHKVDCTMDIYIDRLRKFGLRIHTERKGGRIHLIVIIIEFY